MNVTHAGQCFSGAAAEECTASLLDRIADLCEDRDTWRDVAILAIDKVARQTGLVTSQTATIRRLTAELRELRDLNREQTAA